MKKYVAATLAAMILLLTGCAAGTTPPAAATPSATATPSAVVTESPTPTPTPTPTATATAEPTATPAPTEDLTAEAAGTFDGDEYTNSLFGMTMTKDQSYTAAPMDQARQVMQSTFSSMNLGGMETYFNFMLMSTSTDPNATGVMMMMSLKPDKSAPFSPEDFVKALGKPSTVKINGVPFAKASMEIASNGMKMTQTYYCVKRNDYILVYILISTDKKDATALDGMMKTVKFK